MTFSLIKRGDPNKQLVLFLHGFMGDKEDWLPIMEELKNDFYCVSLDLPGHGQSPIGNFQHFSQVTNALYTFLEEDLISKKAFLIGYSLGGRVGLPFILNFPHFFTGAVLESSSPGIQNRDERKARLASDLELLKGLSSEEQKKGFLNNWFQSELFGNISKHPNFPTLIEKRLKGDFTSWHQSLKFLSVGSQGSLWDMLSGLKVPTLYITGDQDLKYQNIGKELEKKSSLITHKQIKDAAHNTHFENKEDFTRTVLQFFQNQLMAKKENSQ